MKRGEGGKEDKHNSLKKTGETSEQNKIIEWVTIEEISVEDEEKQEN